MFAFTDNRFTSAAKQHRIIHQWQRFLQTLAESYSDKERLRRAFTKLLYSHLINRCSFIAHWDRQGFFDYYFMTPMATRQFIGQFDSWRNPDGISAEFGFTYWINDSEDRHVNDAMRITLNPQLVQRIEEQLQSAEAAAR